MHSVICFWYLKFHLMHYKSDDNTSEDVYLSYLQKIYIFLFTYAHQERLGGSF